MNSINSFLNELSNLGINLWLETVNQSGVETSKLKYSAPKEAITPALLSELKERKAKVIQFLQANQNQAATELPNEPVPRDGNLPLSFAQQRLWFIEQLEGKSATYNWPLTLRFKGSLNLLRFKQSLTEIVRRHEALRTTFTRVNNTPVQKIHPPQAIDLPVIDLQSLPASEREAEARQLIIKEQKQPFDLVRDSLFRVMLVRLEPNCHLFSLTMHHIIADGWFKSIFMEELAALYEAFCAGKPSSLAELTLQYADFAAWQREYFQGEVLQRQINYWKRKLAGIPPLLELSSDRSRPTLQTFTGDRYEFHLNQDITQQVKALSKQSGTTLFMTLLKAFATLLHRYSGDSDIVIGSPINNRNRSELEKIIGFFVNTLALRIELNDNPTFEQLLTEVKQTALDAYEYQDLPFEKLVEELKPERNLSHSPVFQTMFIWQNFPLPKLSMSDLDISMLELNNSTTKFDLTLEIREVDPELTKAIEDNCDRGIEDGLIGRFEYNTDLFDAATIARMADNFQTLLEAIVTNPKQPIDRLPLLATAQQQKLLVEWNDTKADYPHICIHKLFEHRVEETPKAIAFKFEERELTYFKLNEKANRLAHYLQSLGVKPGVKLGICLERSPEMIIALLATLKAGGAYVPLDPSYPPERLAYMLDDSDVAILLTTENLLSQLPANTAKIITLETKSTEIEGASSANPSSEVKFNDLAYIIYTSGSTGKPKGVMIAHQGLSNLATAQVKLFDVNSNSRVLQFASFSFDAAIWEIVMALGSGACLCLGTKDSLLPGENLMELLRKQKITHVTLPPSALAILPQQELRDLEVIIVAGEACPPELAQKWSQKHRFFNAYGPSESTVCATVAECKDIISSLPIGKPIANTEIYILDKNLQPVPIGVPGELHISSVGLAKGYLNRPKLTTEKFIPNPFTVDSDRLSVISVASPTPLLYKTGDLAKYLPDGKIEFIGRIDNQVKIRGFRIELGEIESALAQNPDIEQSVVIAREGESGDKHLTAYIVPKQNHHITNQTVRNFLRGILPKYMIPSFFVVLKQMPLTPKFLQLIPHNYLLFQSIFGTNIL